MLVAVVVLAALGVARLLPPRVLRAPGAPLRRPGLVVGAVLAQLLGSVAAAGDGPGGSWSYPLGLLLSAGCVLLFLLRNRRLPGGALLAAGLLANLLAVVVNGAMPVSVVAAQRAGSPIGDIVLGLDPRHELAGSATRLPWLTDVVPVPVPLAPQVVSAGDLLVAAGVGLLVGQTGRRRRPVARRAVPASLRPYL